MSESLTAFLSAASAIAVATAERFDGTGFPLGLKGDAIPFGARILAVAEAYDHLVARRAHLAGRLIGKVIARLTGALGHIGIIEHSVRPFEEIDPPEKGPAQHNVA